MAAEAHLADGTLVLSGPLDRDAASRLWPQLAAHAGSLRHIDLQQVSRVDSAGLALLATLATLASSDVTLTGAPDGLNELTAAYRLSPQLGFASSPSSVV